MIKRIIFKLLTMVVLLGITYMPLTNAYFSDTEVLGTVTITTGDWTAPYVRIDTPLEGSILSGSVEIYGTVTDNNLHHYWLVIEDETGKKVAGPGTVNKTSSFTNRLLYTWDTSKEVDGEYLVKLEARDGAGNKKPDQSPVVSDPGDPDDSVHWVKVTIKNPPAKPTGLVIYQGHNPATRTLVPCGGTVTDTKITIDWEENTESDLAYYWFGTQFTQHHRKVYPPTSEYRGNLTPGHNPYYYTVTAVDTKGNESEVATTCEITYDPNPAPPSSPAPPKIVINEVYQDNDNPQEWVELYNGTSSDVLLENWTIEDNYSSDTLPAITLPAGKFGVIVTKSAATPLKTQIISNGAVVIELGSKGIGNGLSKDGDRLILKNDKGVVVDQVSWGEDTSIFTLENILSGQSIIRNPLGKDTDTAADWQTNTSPNPGTNPHSHIQVSLKQSNNDLLIGFTNAFGFDLVKYNITYSHEVEGQRITERVEGEESKVFENTALDLKPIYFGTCSSLGKVCVPHKQVDDVVVSLLYKNGQEILGTSTIPFTWNNTK